MFQTLVEQNFSSAQQDVLGSTGLKSCAQVRRYDQLPMADQPSLPARVGHYSIVRKLGEGGMGIVYAARDERLQRTVAVKTMSSLARDETAQRRFWREARAAASVNHPNICQIHEIGEDNGQLFIAMELLEGEVLSDRLRRGALTLAESMPPASSTAISSRRTCS